MPGRVAHALIRKQIETYHAQGLPEEALHLVDATLRSNPDLPEHKRRCVDSGWSWRMLRPTSRQQSRMSSWR